MATQTWKNPKLQAAICSIVWNVFAFWLASAFLGPGGGNIPIALVFLVPAALMFIPLDILLAFVYPPAELFLVSRAFGSVYPWLIVLSFPIQLILFYFLFKNIFFSEKV